MSFPRSSYSDFPFDVDSVRDEFPFTQRGARDRDFRSTIDSIAQRHPEIADTLKDFKESARPRNTFRRPFGDRFPFEDEDIDLDEYTKQFYNPPNSEQYYQPKTSVHQEASPSDNKSNLQPDLSESESQSKVSDNSQQTTKGINPNIQQSNTIDLGQKQEPIDDRNQRSMSAPPEGDTKKRFTSSINIPVNNPPHSASENMANNQQDQKPTERIIPIQIEGRDDPIIPKNTHIPQANQSQNRPERIFGQRPETFTQFVRPDQFGRQGFSDDHFSRQTFPDEHFTRQPFPEEHFTKHNIPSNFQQRPKEHVNIPVSTDTPKGNQQQQQQQQSKPEPNVQQQQPSKPSTPIEQIQMIQQDVLKLMEQVEKFNGLSKDKQYIYLDEMLTRNLLKLDNIESQGQENIRTSRKEAIKCIEQAISLLESKAAANTAKAESEKSTVGTSEQTEAVADDNEEPKKMDIEPAIAIEEKMKVNDNLIADKLNEQEANETPENRAVLVMSNSNTEPANLKVEEDVSTETCAIKDEKKEKKGEKKD